MKTVSILLFLAPLLSYPAPVAKQFRPAPEQSRAVAEARDEIPTVAFCELVNNPHSYFDKTVRTTATYRLAFEGAALADDRCPLSNHENIGVGFVFTGKRQRDAIYRNVDKIGSGQYGNGWAQVTVVGLLRNISLHEGGLMSYQYRFDIVRFEKIREAPSGRIINYDGNLRAGWTYYRAKVRGDKVFDLVLTPPLEIPMHQSVGVDWTNLDEFPALKRLSRNAGEREIIFRVISDRVTYMGGRRWSKMLVCKIITVE